MVVKVCVCVGGEWLKKKKVSKVFLNRGDFTGGEKAVKAFFYLLEKC